jgi:hypothetical protein
VANGLGSRCVCLSRFWITSTSVVLSPTEGRQPRPELTQAIADQGRAAQDSKGQSRTRDLVLKLDSGQVPARSARKRLMTLPATRGLKLCRNQRWQWPSAISEWVNGRGYVPKNENGHSHGGPTGMHLMMALVRIGYPVRLLSGSRVGVQPSLNLPNID